MNSAALHNVNEKKDIGVIITDDLIPTKQYLEAIKKAKNNEGFIGMAFNASPRN